MAAIKIPTQVAYAETEVRVQRFLPLVAKSFAQNHFTMVGRSRDLSTMEKTFAKGRIMHLQSIFHYGDFINVAIRE